ncbi:MAG: WecB/TagA/CpsF family glycosyltransferase [Lachnospiraceae bacterium]|nr:WecB/TagA/CpsF family glycosyltransferase [Lachnospiraceae bacterium]
MKKINLLGISLTDYSLKESLKLSNQYINNGALNTISVISTQILVEAAENPQHKEWIESMDLTILGETDILRAADNATRNRLREVEKGEFLQEFFHRIARGRKTVYLLANSEQQLMHLKERVLQIQQGLNIVGQYVLEDMNAGIDSFINEVNDVVPTVIVSKFPYPLQEQLIFENKMKVNADVWLALPEHSVTQAKKGMRSSKLVEWFYRKLFYRRVSKYAQKEQDKKD